MNNHIQLMFIIVEDHPIKHSSLVMALPSLARLWAEVLLNNLVGSQGFEFREQQEDLN
jgi:hypothetical protein